MIGADVEKEIESHIEEEFKKIQQAKQKKAEQIKEQRRLEKEHNIKKDKYLKQEYWRKFFFGLFSMLLFLGFVLNLIIQNINTATVEFNYFSSLASSQMFFGKANSAS